MIRKFALLAIMAFAVAPTSAQACRCTEPSASLAYSRADAVARVIIRNVSPPSADGTFRADAEVSNSWKRRLPSSVQIITGEDCAYPLAFGGQYILYLFGKNPPYGTYRCRGNREFPQAADVQRWLERHAREAK